MISWHKSGPTGSEAGAYKKMIAARYLDVVQEIAAEILAQAEKLTRQKISALPDGIYEGTELVDDDAFQTEPIRIVARVIIDGSDLTVDFTGTDGQVKGFVNTSIVTTTAAAGIAVLWTLGGEIPRNGGAFRTIKVNAPYGSLVNPRPPAPVTLCTLTPAGEIISAIFKALAAVVPLQVPAGYGRFCGPSFFGVDPHGKVLRRFCLLRPRFGRGHAGHGRQPLHGAHVQLWRCQNTQH